MADPKPSKAVAEHEKLVTMYVNQKLKHDKAEEDNRKSTQRLIQSVWRFATRRNRR